MLGIFFWPFIVAIITAIVLDKLVEYIVKKTKISRKLVGSILVFVIYALVILIVYILVSKLLKEAISIAA